ncbi:hypothetical protein [Agromyces bauzanensis]
MERPDPERPASSETDALVNRIVANELETLRQSFGEGAEFAVAGTESSRERVLHRLECPVLEPHLDRHTRWDDRHRSRLGSDPDFRLPLPVLLTRESAQHLDGVRSCKICWPNVHGTDPRPLRQLQAKGLRPHHVGHMLSSEDGSSLGTIMRSTLQTEPAFDGLPRDEVEVVTSWRTLYFAPTEHVYIWDLPTDDVAIERKIRLFQLLGSGLTQIN